jgi:ketosteroid isomerase-like protein
MLRTLFLAVSLVVAAPGWTAAESDAGIHQELRAITAGIESAINAAKYGDLKQYFHKNMRVTTINQEVMSSPDDIEPYFNKWFGQGGYLKKLHMTLTPDVLTELYGNKTWGVVRGSGVEKYDLSDTRHFNMKTRWTATVIKDQDGKWRILTLHIGTNFLDNPVINAIEGSVVRVGIASGIAGLIVGLLVMMFIRRRKGR